MLSIATPRGCAPQSELHCQTPGVPFARPLCAAYPLRSVLRFFLQYAPGWMSKGRHSGDRGRKDETEAGSAISFGSSLSLGNREYAEDSIEHLFETGYFALQMQGACLGEPIDSG